MRQHPHKDTPSATVVPNGIGNKVANHFVKQARVSPNGGGDAIQLELHARVASALLVALADVGGNGEQVDGLNAAKELPVLGALRLIQLG